jgi:hypothetical protein
MGRIASHLNLIANKIGIKAKRRILPKIFASRKLITPLQMHEVGDQ